MLRKLSLLFIIVPLVELILLITVGKVITFKVTLLIIVITGLAGAALVKNQGLRTSLAFRTGQASAKDAATDGIMILAAGLMLLTPGFLTDIVGFAALIPGLREKMKKIVMTKVKSSVNVAGFGFEDPPESAPKQPEPNSSKGKSRPTVIDV